MAFSHQIVEFADGAEGGTSRGRVQSGGLALAIDEAVAAAASNLEIAVAFAVADLQSVYLVSDVNLTIKTNSASNPGDCLVLTAGVPVHWDADSYTACPFTADVTAFFVTGRGSDGTLTARFLVS